MRKNDNPYEGPKEEARVASVGFALAYASRQGGRKKKDKVARYETRVAICSRGRGRRKDTVFAILLTSYGPFDEGGGKELEPKLPKDV